MPVRILFIGDIHLGRRPVRLPGNLGEYDVSAADLTPVAAWRRSVRYAAEQAVDAVVLAGDVVEADNARFEAYGQLHEGVTHLADRGIPVFAVAGNHDGDALPRLADSIGTFRLLGRGGRWETVDLERDGRLLARLVGWSFPAAQYTGSPLESEGAPTARDGDVPLLGVLHCDIASSGSYAPVSMTQLEQTAVAGWFLGHIHKPSPLTGPRPIGYLGSLVGLDPTEDGLHGPRLVTVSGGAVTAVETVPLAPLRWEYVEVPISDLDDPDLVEGAINASIDSLHRRTETERGETLAVGCRVTLTGTNRHHRALRRQVDGRQLEELRIKIGGVLYFVDRVFDGSRPALDLEALAGKDNPPALLAARLLSLLHRDDASRLLVQRARVEMSRVMDERSWSQLERSKPDEDTIRRLLIDAGTRALEELLEQANEARP
jgi:exonuclease SbcD